MKSEKTIMIKENYKMNGLEILKNLINDNRNKKVQK